jgi:hypothetical protein
MSIDIQTKSAVISSAPHSDLSLCAKEGSTPGNCSMMGFLSVGNPYAVFTSKAR